MELLKTKCPYCGKDFLHEVGAQSCFCTHCGKRVILRPVSANVPNQNRGFQEEQGEEYDSGMRKKLENYEYAKRIGLALVIIAGIIGAIIVNYDENAELTLGYGAILLPFIVEVFYPYPDEWGIVRKAWKCFVNGLVRSIKYGLILVGVFIAAAVVLTGALGKMLS